MRLCLQDRRWWGDFLAWKGKRDTTGSTDSLNPSVSLSLSTVIQASKKWQSPSPSASTFAPRLLPLLRLLPSQALQGEGCGVPYRPSQLPPAGQSHVPSQGSGEGMTCGQTFSCLSSTRMEDWAEKKVRGPGVGDSAGCPRPMSCCFVLCHKDRILFILFCFQFIERAPFTHIPIKVFP